MIEGVIRTRVGYAGGRMDAPTYRNMGDHTETVQVDYDPERVSYVQLLDIFWNSHQPTNSPWRRQYMNAVFYHDEKQRRMAEASKTAIEEAIGQTVKSEVAPLRSFTMAEDYHQKYNLKRNDPLTKEIFSIYSRHRDFVDSTAVARLNGYAGGTGRRKQLEREIDRLGLSAEGQRRLEAMVR